ncbi:hypothetical protein OS493_031532 [Desmophyllum pertusum]|uniref:Uncharacterized protein n=1 Tax=Desmophyllum pertusum TaxID=174260 RepID=A0A9W9Z836_9CNID|nr:hypothetical protein OS493_031532 [Desmophyllum pertusum]
MEGVEKIEEEKEKCDGDDRDSSDSDIEFVKAVNTKSHAKVERGSTVDDKYAKIPSSEGSEDDEGEDAVDEGNPFKTMPTMHFGNDPSTPYLYKGKYTLTFQEKMHILLLDVDSTKICTKTP